MILGVQEIDVVNELQALEDEGIICGYHTMIDWEKTSIEKVSALIDGNLAAVAKARCNEFKVCFFFCFPIPNSFKERLPYYILQLPLPDTPAMFLCTHGNQSP